MWETWNSDTMWETLNTGFHDAQSVKITFIGGLNLVFLVFLFNENDAVSTKSQSVN